MFIYYKDTWQLVFTNLLLAIGAIVAYTKNQHELAYATILMLVVSLIPHYLKRFHKVHIPIVFVYGSVIFIFASLILGQFNKFYEKFHWYDAFLHFISALVFGIIGFLIIYVFYSTNRLKIPRAVVILYSFSFALMIGALWEILEFIIDRSFGTNLQVNSLEDTMVDLILDAVGALLASFVGYLYLAKISVPVIESIVQNVTKEVVVENIALAKETIN